MAGRINWYGDVAGRRLESAAAAAIQRAGLLLMTRARLLASVPAKRIRRRRGRGTSAGPRGSQYTQFVASRPGQPPALRTGFGRRNIDMEFLAARLVARIGARRNADYMSYLEVGTRRIAPRPWLKPAIDQTRGAIMSLLETGLRSAVR